MTFMITQQRTRTICKFEGPIVLQGCEILSFHWIRETVQMEVIKPGFHYTANATTTTQKQSDCKVEQSSFTLITLFSLKIGHCRGRGRNWLNGNQA